MQTLEVITIHIFRAKVFADFRGKGFNTLVVTTEFPDEIKVQANASMDSKMSAPSSDIFENEQHRPLELA